jgi:hypothetical protein
MGTVRRRSVRHASLLALALGLAAGCGREPEAPVERAVGSITADRIAAHGRALAADRLAGRHHASPEADSAAAYLLSQLRGMQVPLVQRAENLLGSHPASFGHHFSVTLYRLGGRTQLHAVHAGIERSADPGQDFVPLVFSQSAAVEGRIVRVAPDSPAPRPLSGAIALVDVPGRPAESTSDATLYAWARRLGERGAAGVLFAGETRLLNTAAAIYPTHLSPEQRAASISPRGMAGNLHADRLSAASQGQAWRETGGRTLPVAVVRQSWADRLHTGDLVRLTVELLPEVSLGENVLVGFRGNRRPHEIVVLGAHYDHAGVNAAGDVLNGANDNASGVAALLEVASALTTMRAELDRSVVLAFFAAARVGLQGSDMLLHDLPMLLGGDTHPVAMLSVRAVGHDDGNPMLIVGGTRNIDLAAALERYDRRDALLGPVLALRRFDDETHELGRLEVVPARASDHLIFSRAGVPAVLLTDGMDAPPLPSPDDDWRGVNSDKVARVARLVLRTTLDLASAPLPATLPAAAGRPFETPNRGH